MPSKDYVYKTFGEDQECVATVHYEESEGSPKAIAIACHGGAWCGGDKGLNAKGQVNWLIKNGFIVVAYNYRLCPNVSLMDGPYEDTREVYHWSRKVLPTLLKQEARLDVDTDRIVAFGGSAGGTLAMILGHEIPRPKAILNIYGFEYFSDPIWKVKPNLPLPESDPVIMAKVFDEPVQISTDASDMDQTHPRPAWVLDKIKHATLLSTLCKDDYDAHDPMTMKGGVDRRFPPTYFLHGTADVLVPVSLAKRCCEELEVLGVDTGISIMEGGGHGYDGELKDGDAEFELYVLPGLEFLKRRV